MFTVDMQYCYTHCFCDCHQSHQITPIRGGAIHRQNDRVFSGFELWLYALQLAECWWHRCGNCYTLYDLRVNTNHSEVSQYRTNQPQNKDLPWHCKLAYSNNITLAKGQAIHATSPEYSHCFLPGAGIKSWC